MSLAKFIRGGGGQTPYILPGLANVTMPYDILECDMSSITDYICNFVI